MDLLVSLNEHVGRLVHPAARVSPIEFARHRGFLLTRAVLSLSVLVAAPLYLAFRHSPAPWQVAILACFVMPLAGCATVSRSGRLALGEALSVATWIGLAAVLTIGAGSTLGLALLLMVPIEVSARQASAQGTLAVAVAAAVGLTALSQAGLGEGAIGDWGVPVLGAAAIYACWLALGAEQIRSLLSGHAASLEEAVQAFGEATEEVVLRLDRSGSVASASASADRILAVPPRDLIGRGLFQHVHVADRPAFLKLVADASSTGIAGEATVRVRRGDTRVGESGIAEPIFVSVDLRVRREGAQGAVLLLVRDATERCRYEEEIAALRRDLQHSRAARDAILANVSHELRTPLNAIIGFSEILSTEGLASLDAGKRQDYAGIIHRSGHHLLGVVNGILDASKIEAGAFTLTLEAFDLADLLGRCCEMVSLEATRGGMSIVPRLDPRLPQVVGDVRAVKQIVINLLSNAIKFTPSGGTVTVTARPDGTSVLVSVEDTGVGIAPDELGRVGDPFFQAHKGYDRAFDGTGLGLSVVRGLVGLHGGRIAIESAPGQGTCVTVRLPIDGRASTASPKPVTKIETIARYRGVQGAAVTPAHARIQRSA